MLFLSCLSKGSAEVVIEFDGKNWVGGNKDANFEKRVAEEGLCIVADAKCQVGDFLRDLDLDKYHAPSIRFALKGIEGKGAKFDTVQRKEDPRKTRIVATCHTAGVDIGYIDMETNTLIGLKTMDIDLIGADGLIETVKEGVKYSKEKEETSLAIFVIRSKCSYGLMVRTLQLIRAGGCRNMIMQVDDFGQFPTEIEAEMDPKSDAFLLKRRLDHRGRIKINVRSDNTVQTGDFLILPDDMAVREFISQVKTKAIKAGFKPVLSLTLDEDSLHKYCQNVVMASVESGINEVIFSVNKSLQNKPEVIIITDDHAEKLTNKSVEIYLSEEGVIYLEGDQLSLDKDPKVHELPMLKAELKKLKSDGKELAATLIINRENTQQRVIDVLNALAEVNISTVTFFDPNKEK